MPLLGLDLALPPIASGPHAAPSQKREGEMRFYQGRRRPGVLWAGLTALGLLAALAAPQARAEDTIKIGVLHSLSGTMAISETTLKDTILMMVDDIDKKGGLLGKKVEAVVVDPASNWPLFAEKARDLLSKERVADRKSVV